ncbi:stability determinant [Undibacterium sp. Di26W]|uniref:type II toxin-antitoxin system RelB family antitoxin n=1 Tax=Undibacterium sp. Di26W TaxID=3413035 RepID=UPI003BF3442E
MTTELSPIVSEFATAEEAQAYEAWKRAKIEKSMADTRPGTPHDQVMARAQAIIDAKQKKHAESSLVNPS